MNGLCFISRNADWGLVDPRSRTREVYRPGVEKEVLRDGDELTVPALLPRGELVVAEVWTPEFD